MNYDTWKLIDPDDDDDEPEVYVECSVCGGDAPATLEWADPGYQEVPCRTCPACWEPLCEKCTCSCEEDECEPVQVARPPSPIVGLCDDIARSYRYTLGGMGPSRADH